MNDIISYSDTAALRREVDAVTSEVVRVCQQVRVEVFTKNGRDGSLVPDICHTSAICNVGDLDV